MRARMAAWRAVLRIARRDARRARGRSALIVAMVALPVLALSFADVLARSAQPSTEEELTWRLGSAQAELSSVSRGSVQQSPDAMGLAFDTEGGTPLTAEEITALLPPGIPTLTWSSRSVRTETASGTGRVSWVETEPADPMLAGRYTFTDGRTPREPGEVAVTPALLDRLGVRLGHEVELVDPAGRYEVVGLIEEGQSPRGQSFFALPGTLPPIDDVHAQELRVLVGGDPLTWDEVLALNERGVIAYSRAVLLDPPPDSAVPLCSHGGCAPYSSGTQIAFVVGIALVVVLAALEVALLAGAAFAVGARRQAHTLGLLAATGGQARDVRRVVLGGGLVLGLTGGLVGVVLGTLAAAAAIPLLERYAGAAFPSLDVRPLELLAIAAVGVLTGVLAAVLPARAAARQDPVAALQGRRGTVRTPRRTPVIAVIITGAGVALAATGSTVALGADRAATDGTPTAYTAAGLIAGGAGLALVGLIVLSPALVGLAGRLARFLPLAPRLALRDAARHRARSAPAVAAVLAAVSGSVALSLYVVALDDHDRRTYVAALPVAHVGVSLQQQFFGPDDDWDRPRHYDPAVVERALRDALPVASVATVATTSLGGESRWAQPVLPPELMCPLWELRGRAPTEAELRAAEDDPRCAPEHESWSRPFLPGTPVGGPEVLRAMTGTTSPEATAVLAAGGVVVSDPRLVVDGHVRVHVFDPSRQTPEELSTGEPLEVIELPAAVVEEAGAPQTILSPAAARELGLTARDGGLVAELTRLPTQAEADAFDAALAAAGVPPEQAVVERGYVSQYGLGLLALVAGAAVITLGAVGIATGLAQADARPDHATLAAVGAAPRLRRTLAACQALSIAGLGGLLGVAAGFVPGVAFIAAMPSFELIVPWRNLLLILVALPLLAAAAAWLFTRSRLPLTRRTA